MLSEVLKWIPVILSIFITGANCMIFIVIKFNDLKHLEASVKGLTDTLKETNKNYSDAIQRIAKIEGTCKANHG